MDIIQVWSQRYYDRSVKCGDSCLHLRICRVICSECGHTHALLFSSLVPYSQIPTKEQIDIIRHSESDGDFSPVMDNTPSIDESCVRSVIQCFRQFWNQRLLSEAISPMPDNGFIQRCFSVFRRLYHKKSCPILFSITAKLYPLITGRAGEQSVPGPSTGAIKVYWRFRTLFRLSVYYFHPLSVFAIHEGRKNLRYGWRCGRCKTLERAAQRQDILRLFQKARKRVWVITLLWFSVPDKYIFAP